MPTYDTSRAFCTEADVIAYGGYTWSDGTPTGTPTATQVQGFAYAKASALVQATTRAGQRTVPPAASISDTHLAEQLIEANAKGAAYEAWRVMASKNPDDFAIEQMNRLREDWLAFVGFYNTAGERVAGSIELYIESTVGARTISNDASEGETTLTTNDAEERPAPFTMTDPL